MNPNTLTDVLYAIGAKVDEFADVSKYGTVALDRNGEEIIVELARLSDAEVNAIRWGVCSALAVIINLLRGGENGCGPERIAKNMLLHAAINHLVEVDEEES